MKKAIHKSLVMTYSFVQIMRGDSQIIDEITPNAEVDSILSIDFERLMNEGYFNYIFDVDNTIVSACQTTFKEEVFRLFEYLKACGCNICLVSNNSKIIVSKVARKLDVPFVSHAGKPFAEAYERALEKVNGDIDNSVFIGDQMITDIVGANRIGLYTILTGPIEDASILVYLTTMPQKIIKRRYDKVKRLTLHP